MTDAGRLHIRSEHLSWRRVDDEVVIVDLDKTVCMKLNSSGAVLWEKLATGATPGELASVLVDSFALDPSQAEMDVTDFIARCRAERILHD